MVSEMVGQIITGIDKVDGGLHRIIGLVFHMSDGSHYRMYHSQDCCESVYIEDICGDLEDLIGYPLLRAEERVSKDFGTVSADCYMWAFYEFATNRGSVTIRWYGESNGYYSIGVDMEHNSGLSDNIRF